MKVYDKNNKELKPKDIILVNTHDIINQKAILKSSDLGFIVVYLSALPNGFIEFKDKDYINYYVEVIDDMFIQKGLF